MSACRQPCSTCPWRRDQHAGSIPNFKIELAEGLVSTTSRELGAPIFACHQSRPEQEVVCVGWLWRYGDHSIAVRMRLIKGLLDRDELAMPEGWDSLLHETFGEVIEKLRADVAEMEGCDG